MLSVEEIEDFVLQLNDAVQKNDGAVPATMASKLHKYADQVRPMMLQLQEETKKAATPPKTPSSGGKKKEVSPSRPRQSTPRQSTTQKIKSMEDSALKKRLNDERFDAEKAAAFKAQQNTRKKMARNEVARHRATERKQVSNTFLQCCVYLLFCCRNKRARWTARDLNGRSYRDSMLGRWSRKEKKKKLRGSRRSAFCRRYCEQTPPRRILCCSRSFAFTMVAASGE